jgi:hypothetical protein
MSNKNMLWEYLAKLYRNLLDLTSQIKIDAKSFLKKLKHLFLVKIDGRNYEHFVLYMEI